MTQPTPLPAAQLTRPGPVGLYHPDQEHDNCGVGFIAHIQGDRSHAIVQDALVMLSRMDHRGACGCETNTGDGAGILTALPHDLLRRVAMSDLGVDLPAPGQYAAGNVFLPTDPAQRDFCKRAYTHELDRLGVPILGWRDLPTDPDGADIGPTARAAMPAIEQLLVARPDACDSEEAFDRLLYLARNRVINTTLDPACDIAPGTFYVCSLSCRTIVYKGMLTSLQVPAFYADLRDPDFTSHLAMVHSRFSTNTFPSWDRAQPCRMIAHNGEINTVKGNKAWLLARQGLMRSDVYGDDLPDLFPIVNPESSDSGSFDNAFEMLFMNGRSAPEAIMMMIPEAWENHENMHPAKRAFYEYHANLIEPWDGPASVSFTDGKVIGATLDRNGLRPSRYVVTDDHRVIMASEVGVTDVDPARVVRKGRLQPGRMFLVDFDRGAIIADDDIKADITAARPYGQWLQRHRIELHDLDDTVGDARDLEACPVDHDTDLIARLRAFGYTYEHLNLLMLPMVRTEQGKEALGSMGNDAALAVLSQKPRLLYDYFKQLFAQVTNPPIDPIREEIIMSLETFIGPEGNLLDTSPEQCQRLHLPQPVLTDELTASLRGMSAPTGDAGWTSRVIDITYPRDEAPAQTNGHAHPADGKALIDALDRITDQARQAVADGVQLVILSDRAMGPHRLAVPALLATGSVHQALVAHEERTKVGLVVESGEPREVQHFTTLFAYGADAVNPYLAFAALYKLQRDGLIDPDATADQIAQRFIKAIGKGVLKVMSKMGISTLASYKGAQIYEAIGLQQQVMRRAFAATASRLQGAGFDVLAAEARMRHGLGYPGRQAAPARSLPNPGDYHWRADGETHQFSPQAIAHLQQAARTRGHDAYASYARLMNDDARHRATLRGLLKLKGTHTTPSLNDSSTSAQAEAQRPTGSTASGTDLADCAIPLDQVEPAADIVKRFRTGAMSLGALSAEAHETLALAMNRIEGQSNSGEGGEDYARFKLDQYPDGSTKTKRSSIKQIASGRFGVTSYYLANADTLQIKIAQGAKPGEGGQLPGNKVDEVIARVRHSTPGVGLISPPPHHDIYSIEDLAQLIFDLKNANPSAKVSVKLVSEVGVGTVAAGVAKAHADHILISGHDGGTGASPQTSIKHAGLPWELGLAETHQTLVLNDLRSRVTLETDGGFKTGRDVFVAACLGAEEFGFSTAPLITIGCIMMRKCHLNTCPVGVCTQDPVLRRKFHGQPEHVINFLFLVAEECRRYMAAAGVRTIDELVGRTDLMSFNPDAGHWKTRDLDLTAILTPARGPAMRPDAGVRKLVEQDHGIDHVLDRRLIELAQPALHDRQQVSIDLPILNTDRSVGAMLSHEISKRHADTGLPDGTIDITFHGSAGQSLGAFLAPGVAITVLGDANDYVGKGLSGGHVTVMPPAASTFTPEEQVIIGNVALFGATSGLAFFRGVAAERFAVRNSGAWAVVEGVGDHGCEYMTGGRVVVLGPTGRNFAAGMSGGIAYVWDKDNDFLQHCNLGMVDLEKLDQPEDIAECRELIRKHEQATGSTVAARVLSDWDRVVAQFVKVMPVDYRRVLDALRETTHATPTRDTPEVSHG
jgi:glutamate synthase (NADPH/NADH) large chain